MLFWREHLKLPIPKFRFLACLVALFWTRWRHIFQLESFISWRMSLMTSPSGTPKLNLMESKVVRSSHAIWMIRSTSRSVRSYFFRIFTELKHSLWTTVQHFMKKSDLPEKICVVCERPFKWRKKWARHWEEVKYCSDRCRGNRNKIKHES